jgi:hypothetical protein
MNWTACAMPTNNQQPVHNTEHKTAVSAKTLLSRSSRAVYPSSSILKNKTKERKGKSRRRLS